MHTLPQKQRLLDLLLSFSQESDAKDREDVERRIWDEFGVDVAVFVLDMSGFSRLTQRFGVVHYLSMVRRMQLTAEPILSSFGGTLIKFEADNCFAVFPDAESAVRAAVNINQALDAANLLTPDELDIGVGCGIDVGKVLLVDDADFFGNAVNRASKLGEDLARPGEILLSADATGTLGDEPPFPLQAVNFSISGIELDAAQVRYRPD